MDVIFDTNSYMALYYEFLKGKSKKERDGFIATLCNRELWNKINKRLSFFVLCEIIQHLKKDDIKREDYFEILCFVLEHNIKLKEITLSVPPEIEVYRNIVGENHSEFLKAINGIVSLLVDICAPPRSIKNADNKENEIVIVSQVLEDYKKIFIDSYQNVLIEIFSLPEDERNKKLERIKKYDGSVYKEIITSLVRHIIGFIDSDKIPNTLDIEPLYKKYFFGTSLMIDYLNRIVNASGAFNYEKHKNDIIDFLICHSIAIDDDSFIVTCEENILRQFQEIGAPNKAMHLNLHLKNLDMPQVSVYRNF